MKSKERKAVEGLEWGKRIQERKRQSRDQSISRSWVYCIEHEFCCGCASKHRCEIGTDVWQSKGCIPCEAMFCVLLPQDWRERTSTFPAVSGTLCYVDRVSRREEQQEQKKKE